MPLPSQFKFSLRAVGPALDPHALARSIPAAAAECRIPMSESEVAGRNIHVWRRGGRWAISVRGGGNDDLSGALLRLLGPIPAEFRALAERCGATYIDVFAGVFGLVNQSSIELSEAAVAALAERRLAITFDCYVGSSDDDAEG